MKNITLFFALAVLVFSACKKPEAPSLLSIDPVFGPEGTLVTIEGENMADIITMKFSGQVVNFNNAYNSDNALLFRVPGNVPLGDHVIELETEGGIVTTDFKVTLDPPEIYGFEPESAAPGEVITIYGENFFDPLTVHFFDSIQATIITSSEDSINVIVPSGVEKGFIRVDANGGFAFSPIQFFSTRTILVNDFDGNGVRAETPSWTFDGFVDQDASNLVHNMDPLPYDNNYIKLTGTDNLNIGWIGGVGNNFQDVAVFENFGITTDLNNTLIEMEMNSNGTENTYIILVLKERGGSGNDFSHTFKVDWEGWRTVSFPLSRFKDLNEILVDPANVMTVRVHLNNTDGISQSLEVNVDNIRFVEIL